MQTLIWAAFIVLVLGVLMFDLFVLARRGRELTSREAIGQSAWFVGLGIAFAPVLYWLYHNDIAGLATSVQPEIAAGPGREAVAEQIVRMSGGEAAAKYLQAWMLEYSLSVDNLFVFAMVFSFFKVPRAARHRVLFWGIIGAILLRGIMIGAASVLVHQLHWVLYLFGAILIYSAVKMALSDESDDTDFERSWITRIARKLLPVTPEYEGDRFVVVRDGKKLVTPLLLVLFVVEGTDVMFAIDSIPAAWAVTTNTFIIFTSNIFAIMGLRSLFFALEGLLKSFWALKYALVVVLAFIGVKMLTKDPIPAWGYPGFKMSDEVSLGIIALSLAVGVGVSIAFARQETPGPGKSDAATGDNTDMPKS